MGQVTTSLLGLHIKIKPFLGFLQDRVFSEVKITTGKEQGIQGCRGLALKAPPEVFAPEARGAQALNTFLQKKGRKGERERNSETDSTGIEGGRKIRKRKRVRALAGV